QQPMIPDPQFDYGLVFRSLAPIGSVLILYGFLVKIIAASSPKDILMALLEAAAVVALITNLHAVANTAQDYVHQVLESLHAHPDAVAQKYLAMLVGQRGGDNDQGFWFKLFNPEVSFVEAIEIAVLYLVSLLTSVVQAL